MSEQPLQPSSRLTSRTLLTSCTRWSLALLIVFLSSCSKPAKQAQTETPPANEPSSPQNSPSILSQSSENTSASSPAVAPNRKTPLTEVELWQTRAVELFPDLAISGSELNIAFLTRVKALKDSEAEELKKPTWPYVVALRVNRELSEIPKPRPKPAVEVSKTNSAIAGLSQIAPSSTAQPATKPAIPGLSGAPTVPSTAPKPLPATGSAPKPTGTFTTVNLPRTNSSLNAAIKNEVMRAQSKGAKPLVEFVASGCHACAEMTKTFSEPAMSEAMAGTYLIKVNLDDWGNKLAGSGYNVAYTPMFYRPNSFGGPATGPLDSNLWSSGSPAKIAEVFQNYARH